MQGVSEDREREDEAVEQSLFLTCMVPLQLYITETEEILWENKKPSSTLLCRPLRFRYVKESREVILEEERFLRESNLRPSLLDGISCKHQMELTMIDGKVQTILSPQTNSTQCCSICGSKPTQMNDLVQIRRLKAMVKEDNLKYGLSTLHAWIRSMEFCLHLSYRLDVKTWQVKEINREAVNIRKKRIQRELRAKLCITVDQPMAGGSGTSNTGNVARRFFQNSPETADILSLDPNLLGRLYVILCILASTKKFDLQKLDQYCWATMELLSSLYPWYYTPQAVHKILVHSTQVMQIKNLPIGALSEEAQESRNKDVKNYTQFFSLKTNRQHTNRDVMRRLLFGSDPEVSSLRRSSGMFKEEELPQEAKEMMLD